MKLIRVYLLLIFITISQSISWIEVFGLSYLYEDMGVISQAMLSNGTKTTSYEVSPQKYAFLSQFQTLTDFCDYKCKNMFNLPCFIVFKCNIQLRNISLIILVPLISVIIAVLFCSKGWWTPNCWLNYIMLFTGVKLIIWIYRKIQQKRGIKPNKQKNTQQINYTTDTQKQLQDNVDSDDDI